jgi:Fic family protein
VTKGHGSALLEHDLSTSPGRYRTGAVYVRDDRTQTNVYEAPDATQVPELMQVLSGELASPSPDDQLVRAAMAHLNLVMIHPFRDGNGRMARALQTVVLAQDQVVEPTFQHRGVAGQQHPGLFRHSRHRRQGDHGIPAMTPRCG